MNSFWTVTSEFPQNVTLISFFTQSSPTVDLFPEYCMCSSKKESTITIQISKNNCSNYHLNICKLLALRKGPEKYFNAILKMN